MEKKLIANGLVVINNGLEINNFNSYWLVKNNILTEEELTNNHIFTNNIVNLDFDKYSILLNRNSIILKVNNNNNIKEDLNDALKKYFQLLKCIKNTIFLSCGINFNWILLDLKHKEYFDLSKKLFFVNNSLFSQFDFPESCFGSYMSKDFESARLKLDIKPVHETGGDFNNGTLHFNFNFHKELKEVMSDSEELNFYLSNWEVYFDESVKIINTI